MDDAVLLILLNDRRRDGLAAPVFKYELRFGEVRGRLFGPPVGFRGLSRRVFGPLFEDRLRLKGKGFGPGCVGRNGQGATRDNSEKENSFSHGSAPYPCDRGPAQAIFCAFFYKRSNRWMSSRRSGGRRADPIRTVTTPDRPQPEGLGRFDSSSTRCIQIVENRALRTNYQDEEPVRSPRVRPFSSRHRRDYSTWRRRLCRTRQIALSAPGGPNGSDGLCDQSRRPSYRSGRETSGHPPRNLAGPARLLGSQISGGRLGRGRWLPQTAHRRDRNPGAGRLKAHGLAR